MDLGLSLTVSGWFVQVVFDKIFTAVIQHWDVVSDIPDLPVALTSLYDAMRSVKTVLAQVQKCKTENEGFLESLKVLIDAAYDAEDLISEVDYYRLERQVTCEKTNDSNTDYSLVKATGYYLSKLQLRKSEDSKASTSSTPLSFHQNDKATLVPRINQIVVRLKNIRKEVRGVLHSLRQVEGLRAKSNLFPVASYRVTTSLWSSNQKVYGRDTERDHIIEMLLSPEPERVSVIPILGMGGIGKTTLARTVFNHEQAEEHFDRRIWIYVSDNFDVARITREMLKDLNVDRFTDLDRLQVLLKKELESERILVVLDDVWDDLDVEKWNMFCAPLGSGKAGSRVLTTTRLEPVARIMSEGNPIKIEGLRDERYLSLFNKCAFGREDPHNHPELADAELIETGRQIACKLSGSPLAAKTVGGLLRKDPDIRHWRSILCSEIWQLPQNQGDIIPVLNLSYQHLPAHLQQCFTFCSVFPKGCDFRKDEMVAMWISHGYIERKRAKKTFEDIGKEYFDDLVLRSFFQTREPTTEMYFVPNLMHDLAVSVSEHECLRIDGNMPNEIPTRIRHLFVHSSNLIHLTDSNLRNLRTLVIHQDGDIADSDCIFEKVLKGLKSIRVLVFHPSLQSLSSNVCQLIHLRYLKLAISHHITQIESIPDSWCKLFHLQWLIFLGNCGLLSLPICMNELVSLRRFFGDGRKFGMMTGIGKLTCLQELESFSIANEAGRKLGELKMLKGLGGSLEIRYLQNVTTKDEALEAELYEKKRIRELQLHCKVSHESPEVAEQVFEGLSPPDYIETLVIDGYGGVKSPIWMVPGNVCVSYLQSLRLSRCLKWKDLPSLGQLRLLRNLEIYHADAVEEVGIGLYGTGDAQRFPRLETLVIESMPQLTVWSGVEEDQLPLFPHLQKLTVMGCPQLQLLPMKELASLEEIETDHMPLLENLQNLGIFKILKISCCKELKSLPPLPTSLIQLNISGCTELLTLFNTRLEETLSNLTSLETLSLQNCPLFTFPSAELKSPPSLKKLIIKGCGSLMSVPFFLDVMEIS